MAATQEQQTQQPEIKHVVPLTDRAECRPWSSFSDKKILRRLLRNSVKASLVEDEWFYYQSKASVKSWPMTVVDLHSKSVCKMPQDYGSIDYFVQNKKSHMPLKCKEEHVWVHVSLTYFAGLPWGECNRCKRTLFDWISCCGATMKMFVGATGPKLNWRAAVGPRTVFHPWSNLILPICALYHVFLTSHPPPFTLSTSK